MTASTCLPVKQCYVKVRVKGSRECLIPWNERQLQTMYSLFAMLEGVVALALSNWRTRLEELGQAVLVCDLVHPPSEVLQCFGHALRMCALPYAVTGERSICFLGVQLMKKRRAQRIAV
jgi:PhoPQ-activated pathogenicity-related protein